MHTCWNTRSPQWYNNIESTFPPICIFNLINPGGKKKTSQVFLFQAHQKFSPAKLDGVGTWPLKSQKQYKQTRQLPIYCKRHLQKTQLEVSKLISLLSSTDTALIFNNQSRMFVLQVAPKKKSRTQEKKNLKISNNVLI